MKCFVICPIGDRHAHLGTQERIIWEESIEIWEKVIEPACREEKVASQRADQIEAPGEIPEQVCRELKDADLVIADVTGGNANVMYELGLRHTRALATIQIGEQGRLPFDIAAVRTIMFQRTEGGLIEARKKLQKAIRSAISEEGQWVTATRVFNGDAPQSELVAVNESTNDDAAEEEVEAGFLEKLVEAEEAMPQLSVCVASMTGGMQDLTEILSAATEETRRSEASGGGAAARLAIAERAANRLTRPAETIETAVDDFARVLHQTAPGMDFVLSQTESGEEEEIPAEFVDGMLSMGKVVSENQVHLSSFLDTLAGSAQISRGMRRASMRIDKEMRRFLELSEILLKWRDRLQASMEDRES